MLRRSRYIPALAVAACGLLAAACSAPAGSASAGSAPAGSAPAGTAPAGAGTPTPASQARPGRTLTAGATPEYTAVAFPRPGSGWLLGQPGSGSARAEIWHSVTAGRTWQPQWQGAGNPLALTATDPAHAWALIACLIPGVGWSGWLVVDTAAFQQQLAVADGGALRLLPGPPDASYVQLLGRGTGFAWGLEQRGGPGQTIVALSRTTDNGRSWRHSRTTLVAPPGAAGTPLLGFSDANHGWLVFGGVTWRTSDGGTGWTRG